MVALGRNELITHYIINSGFVVTYAVFKVMSVEEHVVSVQSNEHMKTPHRNAIDSWQNISPITITFSMYALIFAACIHTSYTYLSNVENRRQFSI